MSMSASLAAAVTSMGSIGIEPATFEAMLQSVLEPAYRVAFHLSSSSAEAAELVQDSAVRAFQSRETLHPGIGFEAWFLGIVAESYASRCPDRAAAAAPCHTMSSDTEAGNECERIRQALATLPVEDRIVTTMHFVDSLSYHDIAQALSLPVPVVRDRLHRGRRQLAHVLAGGTLPSMPH